jgi:hypothetical protein
MNCEDTRLYFIDLIYPEEDQMVLPSGFKEHFVHCRDCSAEYLKLLETRRVLGQWPDQEPVKRLAFVGVAEGRRTVKWSHWFSWRPVPALAFSLTVLLVFLTLVRIHISWENGRFSYQSGLFSSTTSLPLDAASQTDRTDLLQAVDKMLNESEQRQNRQVLVLLQRIEDNLELKRQMDIFQVRDELGLINQNYHQALEKNSVLLEQAARALKLTRY